MKKRAFESGKRQLDKMQISRIDFLKRVIQFIMAGMLAVLATALGKRAVAANCCDTCSGQGICKGEQDCSKFLAEKR